MLTFGYRGGAVQSKAQIAKTKQRRGSRTESRKTRLHAVLGCARDIGIMVCKTVGKSDACRTPPNVRYAAGNFITIGIEVNVVAVGTGQALKNAMNGDGDVLRIVATICFCGTSSSNNIQTNLYQARD